MSKVLSLREVRLVSQLDSRRCLPIAFAIAMCLTPGCLAQAPAGDVLQSASRPVVAEVQPVTEAATPATHPAIVPSPQPTTSPASRPATLPATQAAAGTPPAEPFPPRPGDVDLTALMWQLASAGLVVLVLGGAAIFVIKKLMPRISRAAGRRVTVLETAYLGPRKAVHLIQVGSRRLLVASTADAVVRLDDVTDAFPDDYADVARRANAVAESQESDT